MRRLVPFLFLLSVVFFNLFGGPGSALAEPQDLGPPTSRLTLEIGKGRLIRLDGMVKSVFIADPRIADIDVKSPSLVYVTAKAPGATSLLAVDGFERVLANIEIVTVYDEEQLRADLKRLLPNSDITVSTSNNGLVLGGAAASAAEADTARTIALRYVPDAPHLIDSISVDAPNQINLRVKVAEVSRDLVKSFGFNWAIAATPGHGSFGFSTGTGTFTPAAAANSNGIVPFMPSDAITTPLANSGNILLGLTASNINVELLIDALDTEGLVKVLAEPNLTAISGAPATFLAGGEYPIPVPQALGVTTIQYKDYGVSLNFLATITDNGRINLVVRPEVSQLTSQGAITLNGVTVPALTIRRVQTTVDLASGQSFAIAGLLQNNVNQTINRFPGLGNLPVLGALFRSDSFERDETELVIIVTPYLVRPVSGRLSTPVDGYTAPTDVARVFLGADSMTHAAGTGAPLTRAGGALIGPGGFELE
jgi:pilus assembly protein CpaC